MCLRKQKLRGLQSRFSYDADDDVQLLRVEGSRTKTFNNDYFDPQMTLQRKAIQFGDVIGEGNFGNVHTGTAKDPRPEFEAETEIMGSSPGSAATHILLA